MAIAHAAEEAIVVAVNKGAYVIEIAMTAGGGFVAG